MYASHTIKKKNHKLISRSNDLNLPFCFLETIYIYNLLAVLI